MPPQRQRHVPWTCRWARLGGAVKASASIERADVFWICHPPSARPRLFAHYECEHCPRWELGTRSGRVARGPSAFQSLVPAPCDRFAGAASVRRYAKGQAIFGEGTPSEFFYTVAGGRAKVFKTTAWGRDVILEVRGPGAPLGAVALHEGLPFPFSAAALEDTTCVLVPRDAFFRLLEGYPSLARGLWLGLTEDLSELMDRTATLIGARAEPRFARLFLKMAADLGREQRDGIFIGASLSRQELADLTGTTIETCIRIMSRWKKRRIVRTEKGGFTVIDPKMLKALAVEGPATASPDLCLQNSRVGPVGFV